MGVPSVPGVAVQRAIEGRPGWRGLAGREPVDVAVLAVPPEADLRDAALAALTPLVGPAVGALPARRAAVVCRDGVALVADAVDGRPLAALPPLSAGHAVTVGTAVAQAFCALHARGLTWGGDLSELLVDAAGAVRLPPEGAAARRVGGRPSGPRDDVRALCRLLAAYCPDPGVGALADLPPADATALLRRLRRLGRARPLLLDGAAAPPRAGRRGPSLRTGVIGVAGAFALLAAALVGWVSARPSPARGPDLAAVAPARPAGPDWTAVLAGLDRARAAALDGTGPLSAADATGSPAAVADTATRAALTARHLVARAPVPRIASVRVLSTSAGATSLAVTDTLAAYGYRDAAGRVVATVPARPARTWRIGLVRSAAGWRVASVRLAAS